MVTRMLSSWGPCLRPEVGLQHQANTGMLIHVLHQEPHPSWENPRPLFLLPAPQSRLLYFGLSFTHWKGFSWPQLEGPREEAGRSSYRIGFCSPDPG